MADTIVQSYEAVREAKPVRVYLWSNGFETYFLGGQWLRRYIAHPNHCAAPNRELAPEVHVDAD